MCEKLKENSKCEVDRKTTGMSNSQNVCVRLGIVLGMAVAVATVIYLTPMPSKLSKVQMSEASNPRAIVTANRQIPGPAIQVCQNDILVVDVINRIPGKSVTVHWRGQPNHEAPFMDGVPMVTQCPIPSYTTFQYKFRASQAGTHFYHAYADTDRSNGLFGALIVRKAERVEPQQKQYDIDSKQHHILISEWSGDFSHHLPGANLSKALLINGRAPTEKGSHLTTFKVQAGKRHRFRAAYTSSFSGCPVNLTIADHLLKIIELDGNPITPLEVSSVRMAKGERVDFVLKANRPKGAHYLSVTSDCEGKQLHGSAVILYDSSRKTDGSYEKSSKKTWKKGKSIRQLDTSFCDSRVGKVCLGDVKALHKMPEVLGKEEVDRRMFLEIDYKYGSRQLDHAPLPYVKSKIYRFNNLTFSYPSSPLLTQPMDVPSSLICNQFFLPEQCQRDERRDICECVHLETVPLGQSVEVILLERGGDDEEHILHFHGNHFYVVASKKFDRALTRADAIELDKAGKLVKRNLKNAPLKDTVRVPKFSVVVLRFMATNPGLWMLRDENSHGWSKGLDMVIEVGERHQMVAAPAQFPTCGNFIGPDFFLL